MDPCWWLHKGDCRELADALDGCSIDLLLTDPPYEINHQNRQWDRTQLAFDPAFWRLFLRVLKPGAYAAVFAFPRKAHRLACALEDAGFEIHNQFLWLFGRGMLKGDTLAEGVGTQIKPAYEPIIVARKPPEGTLAANYAKWGTGGIVKLDIGGRLTAPVFLSEDAAAMLEASAPGKSAFFYTAKVGREERNWGCEGLPCVQPHDAVRREEGRAGTANARAGACRTGTIRNAHPCLKPVALLEHLVQLLCPPSGVVLDPFAGALSSAMASAIAGRRWVGAEKDEQWWPVGEARMAAVTKAL